ncbi:MAG: MopE-related protein [Myxococcota bacterium]
MGILFWAMISVMTAFASVPCASDVDCSCGNTCVEGTCGEVGTTGTKACSSDTQCGKGQICHAGTCEAFFEQTGCTPGTSTSCYDGFDDEIGVGVCEDGVQICQEDGTYSACMQQVLPMAEVCDGKDNDCDGDVDEGLVCDCTPGTQRQCFPGHPDDVGVGTCAAGVQICLADNEWSECIGAVAPTDEVCDGLDNDCDGDIDEDDWCECIPGQERGCSGDDAVDAMVGTCQPGIQICTLDMIWSECFDEVEPETEICDGLDNDCDGYVDEDFGTACGTMEESISEDWWGWFFGE